MRMKRFFPMLLGIVLSFPVQAAIDKKSETGHALRSEKG